MTSKKTVNIALVGQAFMGRAHSNAWSQVGKFFDPPVLPVKHTLCARDAKSLEAFAERWDWSRTCTDWKKLLEDEEIDLIDLGTPNHVHKPMAVAALKAGKHVACEKPLASTLADAQEMRAAARKAKGKTFVWYNYRRCPAVAMAHRLVKGGKIGTIRHVRAHYLQDWADESVPLMWRFQKQYAGSGAHGDLNAHIVDMARFVTGEDVAEVCGAIAETFVKERQRIPWPRFFNVYTGSGAGCSSI